MQIIVNNPEQQTLIFGIILFTALIIGVRRKKGGEVFPPAITNELKGAAIIAIVLSHIGWFLSTNTKFLFPFSIFAGAGVDLFLFLSGFGLAYSALKKEIGVLSFYLKRLKKILAPFWIIMVIFLLADWLLLGIHYPSGVIIKNLLGFFPRADLSGDINSPLWFITLILSYYLLFPLVFNKRAPWISALILFLLGYYFVQTPHPALRDILHLWKWHILAFPAGVAFAGILNTKQFTKISAGLKVLISRFSKLTFVVRLAVFIIFLGASGYLSINLDTRMDWWKLEQIYATVMFLVILAFIIKPFRLAVLEVIGIFSYEIYLLHWPLLYRYDLLYKNLPAGIATAIYLAVFVGLGFLLQKSAEKILKILPHRWS